MKKIEITVVIPCYNSEKTIVAVTDDLVASLENRTKNYEIILVNDGSKDDVWSRIKELSEKYPGVIGLNLSRNYGQHNALMAGFNYAKGEVVVTMDDDGQNDPKYIWDLIDKLSEGFDVVIARYPKLEENGFRRLGSLVNKKMAEALVDKPKNIRGSSYRAFRSYVIKEMIKYDKSYPYLPGLIYRVTKNVTEVSVEHKKRMYGQSGYTLKKLVSLVINGFTAFSVKPLRVSSFIGCMSSIIGFIFGIVVIIRKLLNPIIQMGYSSMMSVLLFIGGLILLSLGIIGEYVGRIYIGINNSPQFVVKEISGSSTKINN